jgi:transcription elongation factor S-II
MADNFYFAADLQIRHYFAITVLSKAPNKSPPLDRHHTYSTFTTLITRMDRREIEQRGKDLQKLAGSTDADAATDLKTLLKDLQKNVKPTEELLRATGIGKIVNKLKIYSDRDVGQLAADIVTKWRHTVNQQKLANGGSSGTATPTTSNRNGTLSPMPTSKPAPPKSPAGVPPDKRNWKADKIARDSLTSDASRNNCIGLMYDGLCLGSEMPSSHILDLAKQIESAALSLPNVNSSPASTIYRDKIRSLYQNLKNKSNPQLRTRVLSGEISPSRFVRMTHEELKSKEQREVEKAIQKENMNNAMVAQEEYSVSKTIQCGKCKQYNVKYTQAQTRSADEPMTTFCECMNCGTRWKFS